MRPTPKAGMKMGTVRSTSVRDGSQTVVTIQATAVEKMAIAKVPARDAPVYTSSSGMAWSPLWAIFFYAFWAHFLNGSL